RAGADFGIDRYEILDVQGDDGDAARLFYTRDDITGGLHGDLVWEPEPGVVITPGVRADVYLSGRRGALALEPRVAAEFAVGHRVTLEHTFGVAHQAPSFIVPVPGFQLSDLKDGLQRTIQSSAGVLVRPGSGFQLGLTLFHNVFLNLTDFLGTVSLREQAFGDEGDDEERIDLRSLGQGYGLEVSIRRAMTQRLGGYFAYTLSRTTRSLGRAHQPASFDRTHVLHAALGYALGRNWHAGGRFTFYTGAPAQRNYDEVRSNPVAAAVEPAYRRGPAFYRLDLRLEKRWPIAPDGRYWSFVVEMLNSTLHREVPFYSCDADGCEGEAVGPVTIPSIGVEVFF
ncbi:MAG TPA: energy transducer TonB, partial [Polyangiaceae bacterium]